MEMEARLEMRMVETSPRAAIPQLPFAHKPHGTNDEKIDDQVRSMSTSINNAFLSDGWFCRAAGGPY